MPRARLRVHRAGKKFNLAGACGSLRTLRNGCQNPNFKPQTSNLREITKTAGQESEVRSQEPESKPQTANLKAQELPNAKTRTPNSRHHGHGHGCFLGASGC